jgi:hypothetical protein
MTAARAKMEGHHTTVQRFDLLRRELRGVLRRHQMSSRLDGDLLFLKDQDQRSSALPQVNPEPNAAKQSN